MPTLTTKVIATILKIISQATATTGDNTGRLDTQKVDLTKIRSTIIEREVISTFLTKDRASTTRSLTSNPTEVGTGLVTKKITSITEESTMRMSLGLKARMATIRMATTKTMRAMKSLTLSERGITAIAFTKESNHITTRA